MHFVSNETFDYFKLNAKKKWVDLARIQINKSVLWICRSKWQHIKHYKNDNTDSSFDTEYNAYWSLFWHSYQRKDPKSLKNVEFNISIAKQIYK